MYSMGGGCNESPFLAHWYGVVWLLCCGMKMFFSHLFLSILSLLYPSPMWGWTRRMVWDQWRSLHCGPLDSCLSSEAPGWSTHIEEQPTKVFPEARWWGNGLWPVRLGEKRFKRGNRKKRTIRETEGENRYGLLHLSKVAVCGRQWSQGRARQNVWGL